MTCYEGLVTVVLDSTRVVEGFYEEMESSGTTWASHGLSFLCAFCLVDEAVKALNPNSLQPKPSKP